MITICFYHNLIIHLGSGSSIWRDPPALMANCSKGEALAAVLVRASAWVISPVKTWVKILDLWWA
jgi:hypothetical protein